MVKKNLAMFTEKIPTSLDKMRDASCNYETYESRTGTGFSSIYTQCLLDKTKERIKYLKKINKEWRSEVNRK
ncbi:Uncharacterized protein conserved in bacteria [Salmonella enterica subsp. arizonae]|uniref:Uncharacterized protein conserved in bacteria n=1 Tax=Salmonella enterica subsp. arizonae TaxID=59203 RepID=A0A379S4J0_SALER|nr:Uncharacterized protein conserved in bacteria [Salmonella enterica subsp. arizonae]